MVKKRKRRDKDDGNDQPAKKQQALPSKGKHYEHKEDLEWDIQKYVTNQQIFRIPTIQCKDRLLCSLDRLKWSL
jgi:hypothetical protein